jgi:histone H3/H4
MALVVTSAIKELIKSEQMNTAGDFADALDVKVAEIIKKACARAKSNDRKTVRAGDL